MAGGPTDDLAGLKGLLRQSFAFARVAQLVQPGTRSFIQEMERRGIARLFAEGRELADRLRAGLVAPGGPYEASRPEVELAEPDARDPTTGLRLQDIWRYARHLWSIPYQSTPGRNLFYLVRDGAGPDRPLIGIAGLGNAVLGMAQRDKRWAGMWGRSPHGPRRRARRSGSVSPNTCTRCWRLASPAFTRPTSVCVSSRPRRPLRHCGGSNCWPRKNGCADSLGQGKPAPASTA